MPAAVIVRLVVEFVFDLMLDFMHTMAHGHPPKSVWRDDVTIWTPFARGKGGGDGCLSQFGHARGWALR